MTIIRLMLGVTTKGVSRNFNYVQQQKQMKLLPSTSMLLRSNHFASDTKSSRSSKYRVNHLTKGMALTSSSGQILTLEHSKGKILDPGTAKSLKLAPVDGEPNTQPLVVLLPWLMSKHQHVNKFEKLYLKLGYDVLTVRINPWQLLWPVKGSQLVAGDLLGFLEANTEKRPLLVHGFSVGGYLWGELLNHVERDRERYSGLLKRIMGLVWDSAADMQDIEAGLPVAVFPKNLMLQKALKKYTRYHMRTFYEGATQHYIRSSQMFHSSIVRSPALMMFSERDPIGNPDSNLRVRDNWEALGIKTYVKCWEKSHHVGHYRRYPEEYVAEIASFLATIGMLPVACKMQAKVTQ